MFKIEQMLCEVKFVTWVPSEVRMQARKQGRDIDVNAKTGFGCKLWVPWPVDDRTGEFNPDPERIKPSEHGMLWADAEVKRLKPEGMDVLAVTEVKPLGIFASSILNPVDGGSVVPNEPTPRLSQLVLADD